MTVNVPPEKGIIWNPGHTVQYFTLPVRLVKGFNTVRMSNTKGLAITALISREKPVPADANLQGHLWSSVPCTWFDPSSGERVNESAYPQWTQVLPFRGGKFSFNCVPTGPVNGELAFALAVVLIANMSEWWEGRFSGSPNECPQNTYIENLPGRDDHRLILHRQHL